MSYRFRHIEDIYTHRSTSYGFHDFVCTCLDFMRSDECYDLADVTCWIRHMEDPYQREAYISVLRYCLLTYYTNNDFTNYIKYDLTAMAEKARKEQHEEELFLMQESMTKKVMFVQTEPSTEDNCQIHNAISTASSNVTQADKAIAVIFTQNCPEEHKQTLLAKIIDLTTQNKATEVMNFIKQHSKSFALYGYSCPKIVNCLQALVPTTTISAKALQAAKRRGL